MTMEANDALRLLNLFKIASDTGDRAETAKTVQGLLARFLVDGSIGLSALQTARDIVARKNVDDPWAYAFIAVMFLSQREGNAFLKPENMAGLIAKAGYWENEATEAVAAFKGGIPVAVEKMLSAAESLDGDVVVKNQGRWFFKKDLIAVQAICAGVGRLMDERQNAQGFVPVELSPDELRAVVSFVGEKDGGPNSYQLNEEQKSAVEKVARQRFTVVTGGPGTGKTTVVCSFLRALLGKGVLVPADIALVAPTGRAGQRMGEAIRKQCLEFGTSDDPVRKQIETLKGRTVHSLLGGIPPNWKYTAANPLPYKLVIVDESSMVDIHLMRSLLAALNDGCRLVLLGDGDQLPSVDTGAVLGDLVGGVDETAVARLTESNRFRGKLAECAAAINDKSGDVTEDVRWANFSKAAIPLALQSAGGWAASFGRKETEDSCFVAMLPPDAKAEACHERLVEWAEYFGLLRDAEGSLLNLAKRFPADDPALTEGVNSETAHALFRALDKSRILTVVREGAFGVKGVNELLVGKRYGGRLPVNAYEKPGVPVLVTRNTRDRDLFNGDIGITVEGENGMVALFPRGDRVVACPINLLPEHDLAYAITVHKSQGSEFDNVLVLLPDQVENPLLSRPLVYTGITRAKKRAVVMGPEASLKKALATAVERNTGISV